MWRVTPQSTPIIGDMPTKGSRYTVTRERDTNMASSNRNGSRRGNGRASNNGSSVVAKIVTIAVCVAFVLVATRGIQPEPLRNVSDTLYTAIERVQGRNGTDTGKVNGDSSGTGANGTRNASTPKASADGSESGTYQWTQWDANKYPDCYRIVGKAVVDRDVEAGTIEYDGFDSLGRTQRAVGNITKQMVDESAGWRAEFKGDVDTITGWKGNNHKISVTLPNGKGYNGYCYNRSHLVGDCLGGYEHVYNADGTLDESASKSEKQNLVTGTRMQNVGQDGKGGMSYCENLVMDYLKAHPDVTVYYSATPVYDGNDLVCRSVFVDIKSSDGGLDQEVEVFNVESGCTIDYATGKLTAN